MQIVTLLRNSMQARHQSCKPIKRRAHRKVRHQVRKKLRLEGEDFLPDLQPGATHHDV